MITQLDYFEVALDETRMGQHQEGWTLDCICQGIPQRPRTEAMVVHLKPNDQRSGPETFTQI
jgi:hypothetical protein